MDGISIGAFEMAQFCAGYHPDKNRVVTVLELPFLGVETLEQEVAVSSAVYAHPAATEEMAQWNAKLLMTSPMPQYNLVGTGEPRDTQKIFPKKVPKNFRYCEPGDFYIREISLRNPNNLIRLSQNKNGIKIYDNVQRRYFHTISK